MQREKPTILVVEDELDLSEMLQSYLTAQGYDVSVAGWGEEAVQFALNTPFDMILLDIRLPDIDGYEVCRQLRTNRRTSGIPIIFLTEKGELNDRLQGLELGVVDYMTKPFDITELRLRIRNTLNRTDRISLNNTITDLPEGKLVDEQLESLLYTEAPWVAMRLMVHNLDIFRARYGFVAADDVMRAIAMMVRGVVREQGAVEDFIGHLDLSTFLIVTQEQHARRLQERLLARLNQSRDYFYPLQDREQYQQEQATAQLLSFSLSAVHRQEGTYDTVTALVAALTP